MSEQRTNKETRERIDDVLAFVKRQVIWQWVVIGTVFLISTAVAVAVGYALGQWDRERRDRINEACTISERKQFTDVTTLRKTYEYVADLTAAQKREPLNRAIIAQLPSLEVDARTDDAPSYCDEPDVGLPEPDPQVPERPAGLMR